MATAELEKRNQTAPEAQAARNSRDALMPCADIAGSDKEAVILVDMPGVDEKSVNVILDRNVLTITGASSTVAPEGCKLVMEEFPTGEFRREFEISDEFDPAGIRGRIKNGVLTVVLPRGEAAMPKKISIAAN